MGGQWITSGVRWWSNCQAAGSKNRKACVNGRRSQQSASILVFYRDTFVHVLGELHVSNGYGDCKSFFFFSYCELLWSWFLAQLRQIVFFYVTDQNRLSMRLLVYKISVVVCFNDIESFDLLRGACKAQDLSRVQQLRTTSPTATLLDQTTLRSCERSWIDRRMQYWWYIDRFNRKINNFVYIKFIN